MPAKPKTPKSPRGTKPEKGGKGAKAETPTKTAPKAKAASGPRGAKYDEFGRSADVIWGCTKKWNSQLVKHQRQKLHLDQEALNTMSSDVQLMSSGDAPRNGTLSWLSTKGKSCIWTKRR